IATPREGYRFVNWTKDGEEISIYAVYTFAVTEDLTLVANFEEIPEEPIEEETFTLHILANDAAWGLVSQSGNGTYKKDSLATITATPNEGYRFVNWTKEGVSVFATAADTTFAVTENLILIAHFEKIPDEPVPPVEEGFTVTLTPNNSAWGMVFKTGNCIYSEGEEIKILALPFAGYRFVNWTMPDGSVFGTDSLLIFKVTENLDLTANFEPIPAVKSELRLDSIPVGMVAPPLLPNNGLPGFPAEGYPFDNETLTYTAVFYGDSAVLRLCAGNEVRIAMATSGGEGALSYTWTADGGGVSVYESGFALEEWPYVTQDSVLVLFFPDSGTHLLNCHIRDGAGAALDVKVYVGYHTPEPLYIETLPKTTSARYYEGQAVCFQARPQRYADYHWFRVGGREGSAEITDRQVTQETLYPASFKLERPEEQHQIWVSVIDCNGCRIWDSTGVALMKMPNVMVLD
ncbi:MAG: InlB B-repeat-containing protein, partial [Bacteroidales bacterium]|nr:InlB B-repeat-containing protein [Bacteroidales bacterium]